MGNALRALVKNEPFVVGHLAYYAELRAAMSLLASMGMVNIDKEIFCIDKLMHIRRVPSLGYDIKGTHQIVWKLLEEAVSIRNQPAEFLKLHKIFRIGGLTLEDWVVGMSGGESGMSIVSEYVKKWGVDIQNYDSDRKIRNKLSYDISTFQGVTRNDYDGVIELLQDFWSCFEPVGAENFSIDFYLLWLIMQNVRKVKGWDEETYKLKLIAFLQTTALSEADQTRYVNILTRTARSFSALLKLGRSFSVGSGKYYLHIISRATILLRIATVACGDAFQKAGLHASDVEWWINTFAEEKGLWKSRPENYSDLYEDVKEALEDLQSRTVHNYSDFLTHNCGNEINPFPTLGFSEYVMLWGLPS